MDQIKAEKFEAMKNYKENHFLYKLVLHFLLALTCSLLCSHPYWFPSLSFSMKHFFLISLPYLWSSFFNPKCLFVVFNVIVIFLVGESKLLSSSSSPASEIYNEYVERTRSPRRVSSALEKKKDEVEEVKEVIIEQVHKVENKEVEEERERREKADEKVEEDEEKEQDHGKEKEIREEVEIVEEDEEKEGDGEEEAGLRLAVGRGEDEEEIEGDGEEEGGLPAEELNKRVEEFIARVNKQRWLETNSLLLYCQA